MLESFGSDAGGAKVREHQNSSCDLETTSVVLGRIPEQSLRSSRIILSTNRKYRLLIMVLF